MEKQPQKRVYSINPEGIGELDSKNAQDV